MVGCRREWEGRGGEDREKEKASPGSKRTGSLWVDWEIKAIKKKYSQETNDIKVSEQQCNKQ